MNSITSALNETFLWKDVRELSIWPLHAMRFLGVVCDGNSFMEPVLEEVYQNALKTPSTFINEEQVKSFSFLQIL